MKKKTIKLYETDTVSNTIYDRIIKYIEKKYIVRFNTISLNYEINVIGNIDWEILNLSSLTIELERNSIQTRKSTLELLITSNLIAHYDPIKEYFEELQIWDTKTDFIAKIASYVATDNDALFVYHFKKWFVRAVICAFDKEKINKHCFVLANGDQHGGKSTYIQNLIPKKLSNYIAEDIGNDKDSRIKMCKNLIINLEELQTIGKIEANTLKSLISKVFINERLPYDRVAQNIPRICSFIGSTNMTDFLTDETGSVRWIIFDIIGKLNFNYSKDVNIDDVWSQAYYLAYTNKEFNPWLTQKDIIENEKRNEKYTTLTFEQDLLNKYFDKTEDDNHFYTATDIILLLSPLGYKISNVVLGKALTGYKFKKIKHSKRQVYGFLIKPKFKISPIEIY